MVSLAHCEQISDTANSISQAEGMIATDAIIPFFAVKPWKVFSFSFHFFLKVYARLMKSISFSFHF